MFPEPTELLLIVIRQNQFGPQNPNQIHWHQKNKSQTYWPTEISHVMNGTICWIRWPSAISVLQLAPLQWQNDFNKNQEKNVSQPNRDQWWILLPGRRRTDDDMDSNTVEESDFSFKIKIILAQGEWSSAKDAGPIFKRCNTRQEQTFFNMENVYVFNIGSICIHGKEFLRNFTSLRSTRKDLTMKQMFGISVKLITEQSDEIQLTGVILHGNIYLWLVMKKSTVSHTRRCTHFQILCCVLERWIRTQNQIMLGRTSWRGSKVHHNTELWTQLMVSQLNSSGIFPQDSPHCSSATKPKRSWQKWAKSQNNSQDHLHVRGDFKTMNRNAN